MHFSYEQPRSVKKVLKRDWATVRIRAEPFFREAVNKYEYDRVGMIVSTTLGGFEIEYNLGHEPARSPHGWLLSPYVNLIFRDGHLVGYGSASVGIIRPLEPEMKALLKSLWKALEERRRRH